ncbi:MAG: PAS domain S-box protein [Ilumatobacter sp.]
MDISLSAEVNAERHPAMNLPLSASNRHGRAGSTGRGASLLAGVTVLLFISFVTTAAVLIDRSNSEKAAATQRARTESVSTLIDDRMVTYKQVLFGVRSAFRIDPELDHADFNALIDSLELDERLPGIQAIGASSYVTAAELEDFELRVRESASRAGLDYPEFTVTPSRDGDEFVIVDFVEPQIGNLRAFGFDSLSDAARRATTLGGRDSGLPTGSPPLVLVSDDEALTSIGIGLPLYTAGAPIATVEERRAAYEGSVYATFRMNELVRGVQQGDLADSIVLVDVEADAFLYGDLDGAPPSSMNTSDPRVTEFDIAGRMWRILVDDENTALSATERALPIFVMTSGLAVAALLIGLGTSVQRSRRRAEQAAAGSSDELEALTGAAREGIITVDGSGRVIAWNEAAGEVFAWTADEMIGRSAHSIAARSVPGSIWNRFIEMLDDDLDHAEERVFSIEARHRDGSSVFVEASMSPWRAQGAHYITAFVRDVTERVDAERRNRQTSSLLKGVLAAATEMSVIATDANGTVTVFNRGAERMLGYRASNVVGHSSLADYHVPDDIAMRARQLEVDSGFDALVAQARRGKAQTRVWSYVRSDGSLIPVEVTITPRRDDDGAVIGFIAVAVDITERLAADQQQQQLLAQERQMVAKLRELDQAKTDFISTTSHELRTPLTSIIGFTELLEDDPAIEDDSIGRAMLDKVSRNAERLLHLVEDLLMLSQIESGAFQVSKRPCDVARVIVSAEESISSVAERSGVEIKLDIADLPELEADAPGLERVMLNLMSNAVKFTKPGGIVTVTARPTADARAIELSVRDDGIGVPSDEIQHLFTRFFRSSNAENAQIQGSGLGLSIVQSIVERHGGSVDVDSVEGRGTTFTVVLPTTFSPTHDRQEVTQ